MTSQGSVPGQNLGTSRPWKRLHGMSALLLAAFGCSSSEPTPPAAANPVPMVVVKPSNPADAAADPQPAEVSPTPIPSPNPMPAVSPERPSLPNAVQEAIEVKPPTVPFRYESDRGGRAVEQALSPSLPAPLPEFRIDQPRERQNPTAVRDGVLRPVNPQLPNAALPERDTAPLPAALEPLPGHQDSRILEELSKVRMPVSPAIVTPPRPDLAVPDLPSLARPSANRVSTVDPTEALSTRAIIHSPVADRDWLGKWSLPGPLGWTGPIREAGVPEWATKPVPVSPERR